MGKRLIFWGILRQRMKIKNLKKIFWLLPFLLFGAASFVVYRPAIPREDVNKNSLQSGFTKGLSNKALKDVRPVSDYNINVKYDAEIKKIKVAEKIIWRNLTKFSTSEIYFHLYANAYKSNKTLFAKQYFLDENSRTHLDIKSFKVNGTERELLFVQPDVQNIHDSTVAKVILNNPVLPGDSVQMEFDYSLKIPKSVKRFGYAPGTDFALISQWFPKPGVFENGKWNCHQYFPSLNFYSDFADFNVSIVAPSNYKIAATGVLNGVKENGKKREWTFVQNGVHDFAWAVADEVIDTVRYFNGHPNKIKVELFLYPADEKYIERIFKTVFNSLNFYAKNIFSYPYEKITVVDVPPTSRSGGMEYPTLITVGGQLFSPPFTHQPEKLTAHEFTHQFFYGILANNETEEAWLDEGFTSYFASKIMEKYYGKGTVTFKFLDYIPVPGINYLSFSDIPVVYSLGFIEYPEYAKALRQYYSNLTIGTIADTSFKLPTRLSYVVNSYSKPEIMFYVLERILGEKEFFNFVPDYANRFKFKHPKGRDFWALLLNRYPELKWFKKETFDDAKIFDDRIRYLKKIGENEYELFAERLGDGYFPHTIEVYTTADTLYLNWNEKGRFKIFRFRSSAPVVAANLDPARINLFDLNFANNSYTIETKYWGKFSLSIRWFFWLQNALMILGSAG